MTVLPSSVSGRKESLLIHTFPSAPMERTCIRILSAWPQSITVSLPSASPPGPVSQTVPALPRNLCSTQPSRSAPSCSKNGATTP